MTTHDNEQTGATNVMEGLSVPPQTCTNSAPRRADGARLRTDRRSLGDWAKMLLVQGAHAWGCSSSTLIVMWTIPFIVALTGVITAMMGKHAYKWFTGEDGIAEMLQVVLYVLAFTLSLIVLRHRMRKRKMPIAILYGLLSCGFLFMIGEELSWGQRMFGWQTPESFQQLNKQEETNLHNIHGVGTTFKWLQLVVGAYGTILPLAVLLAANTSAMSRHRETIAMLVPHYTLLPYFLLLFSWRIFRTSFTPPDRFYFVIAEYNEVLELVLAMGFVLFLVFQLRNVERNVALRCQ